VYRWCRQAGLQEVDAADVGQDVFRAVAGAIGSFHHDRKGDTFRGWLRTITRNKVRDFVRRSRADAQGVGGSEAQRRLLQVEEDRPADSEESAAEDDRLTVYRRAVELILSGYEERTRQAFLRVVVEQQPPADVARDLGLTVNAVYLAKSRILRRIREELQGLEEL
jgi:RNA polymerase sigma-70 factor (ECF subfamily)